VLLGDTFQLCKAQVGSGDIGREDYLAAVAARLRDVVVPLLNRLGDYAIVTALLEADTGLPPGAWLESTLGSPACSEVLGTLALAAGDKVTAVKQAPDPDAAVGRVLGRDPSRHCGFRRHCACVLGRHARPRTTAP
jgi:hypothetical protein